MGCKHEFMYKFNLNYCKECGYQQPDVPPKIKESPAPTMSKDKGGGKSAIIAVCVAGTLAASVVLLVLFVPDIGMHLITPDNPSLSDEEADQTNVPTVLEEPANGQAVPEQVEDEQPAPEPASRLHALALELINIERTRDGLAPLHRGSNVAAQAHAEAMLNGCFVSHWGLDGLKPYMRYSLAGGYSANTENVAGFCSANADPEASVSDAMRRAMSDPIYRGNMLDSLYETVSIGVASGNNGVMVVHHFEGMSVDITGEPTISADMLSLGLRTDVSFEDYSVSIYYDPPPRRLSVGQASYTYCYDYGVPVLNVARVSGGTILHTSDKCIDPYKQPSQLQVPAGHAQAEKWRMTARIAGVASPYEVPVVGATEWSASDGSFRLSTNVSPALHEFGPGVYTVIVYGMEGGKTVPILTHTILHNIMQ